MFLSLVLCMWHKFIDEAIFTIRKRRANIILDEYISNVHAFSRGYNQTSAFSYNKFLAHEYLNQKDEKSCINLSTRVQIPRTHEKPDVVAHNCNLSASDLKWKVETGRSLDVYGAAILGYTIASKTPCLNLDKVRANIRGFLMTSTCVLWHAQTCACTHFHEHMNIQICIHITCRERKVFVF